MNRKIRILGFLFFLSHSFLIGQGGDDFKFYKIISDTLMNSSQRVFILALEKSALDEFKIDIEVPDTRMTTSEIGLKSFALASINGGFFDMKEGHSVSFIEKWDRIVSPNSSTSTMLNGALIIEKEGDIILDIAKPDSIYLKSRAELSVLRTGPLLLSKGKKSEIQEGNFSSNRHPRTCICETESEIIFLVIDGRSSKAHGMSLYEVQDFMLSLNCIDGLNLDGGGSTAMWIRGKGIVNSPSDSNGERPVANAIIIRPK